MASLAEADNLRPYRICGVTCQAFLHVLRNLIDFEVRRRSPMVFYRSHFSFA